MNGNVTKDGIAKDLAWMKRIGIAGVQTFEININTPKIVDRQLPFMSPGWKDAFHFAASEADRLGLEMAIASSPGFSETGGPWVAPRDAMKKIAWSETIVEGGRTFSGKLEKPPETTGAFQDEPFIDLLAPLAGEVKVPQLYRDSTVFAYRVPGGSPALEARASVAGKPLDGALLYDGRFTNGVVVLKGPPGKPTIVDLALDKPQPVRAVTVFMRGAFQIFRPGVVLSSLEASADRKTWRKVADIAPSFVPVTISFPTVEARFFRLVMTYLPGSGKPDPDAAPGFDSSVFNVFKSSPGVELVELRLSTEPRIDRWEAKAGFSSLPDRYVPDPRLDKQEAGVTAGDVIDLTGRMSPDGTLNWTPPPGRWRVVRMGWSLLGTTNHPAPGEATGLEVDKLDRTAVRRYLEAYLAKYRDAAGKDLFGKHGVRALLTDSTEVGAFNWTPGLLEQFRRLRGYDPRPWLPALTGVIVGSRERSDEFLYDFRRTLGDLHASEHYGTVAAVAHENGLKVYGESLEGSAGSPGDDLDMRRYTDIPMAAQWTYPRGGKPQPVYEADMRGAASVAHFYGRNLVAAESLTSSSNPWAYAPSDLRRIVDLEFASGVNRIAIHTSIHVPRDDRRPGLSLWIYGQYFNRLETWAEMARPWIDYIARSSLLLQAGGPVADVAYFYGEDTPLGAMSAHGLPSDLPASNGYDFVSAKEVRDDLQVDKGDLVSPGGSHYRMLFLGGTSERMTLPVLRRIAVLAEQGATIVGNAPKGSPGLDGDTPDYARLVKMLWSGGAVTQVGRGRVIAGRDVEKALEAIGVAHDFALDAPPPGAQVMFLHRRLPRGDIYFVDNRRDAPLHVEARFRVMGRQPEIWRADTGKSELVSYRIENGSTVVPLSLAPEESVFVVFRTPATAPSGSVSAPALVDAAPVDGPWKVTFQPGRGAPEGITIDHLVSLTDQADPEVKYFSGIATYRATFSAPAAFVSGKPLWLDLGRVGDVAEVRVNGKFVGTSWHSPYRLDIGSAAKPGRNHLEVRIADLWVNRLIGDKQPGATKITFTTTPTYKPDAPLRPSGLIGPVRLLVEAAQPRS